MSPFSHFLHELRMRHGVRQVELAERIGYEQSYISALEAGAKGPPTPEFVDRLQSALGLTDEEACKLRAAADASQRKLVIDADMPQDVYWLLDRLRATLPDLTPTQVRVINEVLNMPTSPADAWPESPRRLRRRNLKEAQM
ncbi:MAG TPA: helix-turn-helix transcriptional regulator [Ottowia sp.]|nr:helix-turn-helix transcriptional regulator [Ottowia sp.]